MRRHRSAALRPGLLPSVLTVAALSLGSGSALAQTGGTGTPGAPIAPSGSAGIATLASDGTAIAPTNAPRPVRKAINAGNRIHTRPYQWGGGHNRKFKGRGYDCSGAVSYVLHAAGMLKRPLASGPLARHWGKRGMGQWITVYANKSHAYAVVAGLRWDTSGVGESVSQGSGPRWRATERSAAGYTARHFPRY